MEFRLYRDSTISNKSLASVSFKGYTGQRHGNDYADDRHESLAAINGCSLLHGKRHTVKEAAHQQNRKRHAGGQNGENYTRIGVVKAHFLHHHKYRHYNDHLRQHLRNNAVLVDSGAFSHPRLSAAPY